MATGPAEPFASDETQRAGSQAAPMASSENETTFVADAARHRAFSRAEPWRLHHLMGLIAATAVLLWLARLAVSSILVRVLLVLSGIVFLFAAVMGGGVILAQRKSTRQGSLFRVLAIAANRCIPPSPAVMLFADQFRGLTYRRWRTWPAGSAGHEPARRPRSIAQV